MARDYDLLVTNKKEYISHLCDVLVPYLVHCIQMIYVTAISSSPKKSSNQQYLLSFQDALKAIPEWNQEKVTREFSKVECSYLPQLLKATFWTQAQLLLYDRDISKIELKIPTAENFYFKCLLAIGRELWIRPFLLLHTLKTVEQQNNLHELLGLTKKCIKNVVRTCIPIETILQQKFENEPSDNEKPVSESEDEVLDTKKPTSDSEDDASDSKDEASDSEDDASDSKDEASDTAKPTSDSEDEASDTAKPTSDSEDDVSDTRKPVSESEDDASDIRKPVSESEDEVSDTRKPIAESDDEVLDTRKPIAEVLDTRKLISESEDEASDTRKPIVEVLDIGNPTFVSEDEISDIKVMEIKIDKEKSENEDIEIHIDKSESEKEEMEIQVDKYDSEYQNIESTVDDSETESEEEETEIHYIDIKEPKTVYNAFF